MAIIFVDGFDHYVAVPGVYTAVGSHLDGVYSVNAASVTYGAFYPTPQGSCGIGVGTKANSTTPFLTRAITSKTSGTLGVGFHITPNTAGLAAASTVNMQGLIAFRNGTTQTWILRPDSSEHLVIASGSATNNLGTAQATSGSTLLANVTYHIEFVIHIEGGTSGWVEVRVNGSQWARIDGIDTSGTIDNVAIFPRIGGFSQSGAGGVMDNLFFWDESGSQNNDWLGERTIFTLMANADGGTQDWTLSSGSDTYALLDGVPPDPDNDYIESTTIDDIAQVGLQNLPSSDITPIAVVPIFQGQKTGTSATGVSVAPTGATPVEHLMTQDQPLRFQTIFEQNPATSLDWTPGDIDSLVLDIKRTT